MNGIILQEKVRHWIPENRWVRKKLTDFRRWLYDRGYLSPKAVRKAFGDPERQRELLRTWERKHPRAAAELDRIIGMMRAENAEFAEKAASEDFLDKLKYAFCAYGFLPYEYYNFGLAAKTEEEYREFFPDKERCDIAYRLNDLKAVAFFNDKAMTYELCREYFHRDCMVVERKKDFEAFRTFVVQHPVVFIKQAYGFGGHEVRRADFSSGPEEIRKAFDAMLRDGKHIVEEPIRQSRKLEEFNASSVNTVRCIMILTKHGPKVVTCFFRTGKAGACVDNAGSGGIFAVVDAQTGTLITDGVDEYSLRYKTHPDSGICYKGYQLPDWDQLLRICGEASVRAGEKGCLNVGWDLAHTEEYGWVMVEGNAGGQLGEQNATQKGMRGRIEALLAEV